jgi:hypothetical protein
VVWALEKLIVTLPPGWAAKYSAQVTIHDPEPCGPVNVPSVNGESAIALVEPAYTPERGLPPLKTIDVISSNPGLVMVLVLIGVPVDGPAKYWVLVAVPTLNTVKGAAPELCTAMTVEALASYEDANRPKPVMANMVDNKRMNMSPHLRHRRSMVPPVLRMNQLKVLSKDDARTMRIYSGTLRIYSQL